MRTLQAVAVSVALAVFLWSTGLATFFQAVEAASITNASDTLSNSAPSGSSVHTIAFTVPNGMLTEATTTITFPDQFDISQITLGVISLTVNGDATTTAAAPGTDIWGVATGTHHISLVAPSDDQVASSSSLVLVVGDELGNMIVNPSATSSYQIDIGTDTATTTIQDSGAVRVAIIDEVTVSASVDTTLEFEVSGVQNGKAVNGTSTTGTTTNISLPFGSLSEGQIKTLAQTLNVTTNATNGYTVTVEYTGELQSSTGATIDGFIDGTNTTTPTSWVSPSGNISDDLTWGHWGITSTDGTTTRTSEFSSDLWVSGSTSPIVIMGHASTSDGITEGVGSSTIGYQIEVSSLQEAGTDYSTTIRYIATPTF